MIVEAIDMRMENGENIETEVAEDGVSLAAAPPTPEVYDNTLYLHYDPERLRDEWGFVGVGQTIDYPPNPRSARRITYHNTYYHFLMEVTVRFMSYLPPLHKDGTAYWRRDQQGRKIPLMPYRVLALCPGEDPEWVPMALLPTVSFNRIIRVMFKQYNISEGNVGDHLWRVYKGERKGYDTGMWGMSYLCCEPWVGEEAPDDPRDGGGTLWARMPNAMRVAKDLQRDVLPHYPGPPREDIYVREIMERLPCEYEEARLLYLARKEVGLP